MQTYIDSATQKLWAFDDDVVVTDTAGAYSFTAAHGAALSVPTTLQPYTAPAPTAAQTAAVAWAAYQAQAVSALAKSDTAMHRVTEGVALGETTLTTPDVVAFVTWRRALRAIISASTGTAASALPTQPPYPVGT